MATKFDTKQRNTAEEISPQRCCVFGFSFYDTACGRLQFTRRGNFRHPLCFCAPFETRYYLLSFLVFSSSKYSFEVPALRTGM